jgi:hypothetical protein
MSIISETDKQFSLIRVIAILSFLSEKISLLMVFIIIELSLMGLRHPVSP